MLMLSPERSCPSLTIERAVMNTELYWIEGPWRGRLAISPRPRGGDWLEHEIRAWSQSGINVAVSLLTLDEIRDLDLSEELELCRANNLSFVSFPIEDLGVPASREDALSLVTALERLLIEGQNILIHCRGGIGRSGLLAASLLVHSGIEPEAAIRRASAARGLSVPETPEQKQWVRKLAEAASALSH